MRTRFNALAAAANRGYLKVGAGVGVMVASVAAHAALPTGVDTAFQTVQTDATSLMGIVAPVVIAILGMMLTIKLIKKFGNKI